MKVLLAVLVVVAVATIEARFVDEQENLEDLITRLLSQRRSKPVASPSVKLQDLGTRLLEMLQKRQSPASTGTRGYCATAGPDVCLNGGKCAERDVNTPTGHNYRCICEGNYGGFVCGVYDPCSTCPSDSFCIRTSYDARGRYCYNSDLELLTEVPPHTGNPHVKLTELLKGTIADSGEESTIIWGRLIPMTHNHSTPGVSTSSMTPTSSITTPRGDSNGGGMMRMSVGLIVLLVLATLCAILGAIYAYIYYTRINPRSARARKYVETAVPEEEGENKVTHTHLFLFRKS